MKDAPRGLQGSGRHYFKIKTAQDKNLSLFDRLRVVSGLEHKFASVDKNANGKIETYDFHCIMRDHVKLDENKIDKFVAVYEKSGYISYVNFLADMRKEKYILEQLRVKSDRIRRYLRGNEQNGIVTSEQFRAGLSRAGVDDDILKQAVRIS